MTIVTTTSNNFASNTDVQQLILSGVDMLAYNGYSITAEMRNVGSAAQGAKYARFHHMTLPDASLTFAQLRDFFLPNADHFTLEPRNASRVYWTTQPQHVLNRYLYGWLIVPGGFNATGANWTFNLNVTGY